MEIDWNVAPINGTNKNCFFTRESFALYSVRPSFIGTIDLESSDGGGQLPTGQQNSVRDTGSASNNHKSDTVMGKKTNTEATGHAEISPKNQAANEKKQAKWMQAKLGLKVLYPRPSNLTKDEQKTYLDLSDRFRHLAPLNLEDYRLLKELQMKVTAEQDEYMAYLESIARQFVADYNTVHPVVEKFVSEYLEKRRRNVYRYPRRYILHDTVPVAPNKGQLDVPLTHISTLLEMGTVSKMIVPNMDESSGVAVTKVPLDYDRVSKRYPQCSSKPSGAAAGEYTKVPISMDVNVDRLLTKYETDLTMSLGAFQCLIDNFPHNINRQWEMAVTVKDYDVTVNGEVRKQKVVCLDSPFIPKTITPQEKNLIYQRLALKTILLHPNHLNTCTLETKVEHFMRSHKPEGGDCSELITDENLFADAAGDLSSLEVFGTDARDHSLSKCVLSSDLAMSDDDSNTGDSDCTGLPIESAMNDAQTNNISPASDDVHPMSPGVSPLSPIPCLDGLVDEKPTHGKADGEEEGECSSGRRRRSSRSQKTSADDELGSGARSSLSTPRRSVRIASRSKVPEFELTDSDTDGNLVIDCMSPKERILSPKGSSDSTVRSKLPCSSRSMLPEESDDASKVICMQSESKDSCSSKTALCEIYLETPSAAVSGSAIQTLDEGVPAEMKRVIESTDLQTFSQPSSSKISEACKGPDAYDELSVKSASESVADVSCSTLDARCLSESMTQSTIDYSIKMDDLETENPLSSISSQTSSIGITEVTCTDRKPAKSRSKGRKRRSSAINTLTEVKVDDSMLVPSASVMPATKQKRGMTNKVNVAVNEDSSMRDLGGGDGPLTGGRPSKDASEPKANIELEIKSMPTPNEQISVTTPFDKSGTQKSRRLSKLSTPLLSKPPIPKSLANNMAVPPVSFFSKSSANDQPSVVQSFLDQLLTEQTRMFDRPVSRQSPQLGPPVAIGPAVQTLALPVPSTGMITGSSEVRQPVLGSFNDRAVSGPPGAMGDLAQPKSTKKVGTLTDAVFSSAEIMSENPFEYVCPSVGNVAYHLWSLGSLKFILRHTHHGVYRPYRQKLPYFMHIQAKLEYQAEHGVEQMTPSEAIRNWTALQLKHRTRLLRAHINTSSSEIFLFENLDQNPLLLKANPSASLTSVHLLLERLTKLGVGTYLVGHMPGSQHIQIKKTTQAERGVYDLHLAYQSTEMLLNLPTSSASYWLPIDPSIRLRYHNKYFRVPCTFEPRDTAMVNTAQQVNFRKNTKKKGKTNS